MSLVIGLMSGTSLDGVDAALVDFSSRSPRTLQTLWHPYPAEIRQAALALQSSGPDEIHRAALLSNRLANCYADIVLGLLAAGGRSPGDVQAIGCHGQTIRHQPAAAYSIQLNNPSLLAELTGISVIADFRSRDIAAGGQGAPLVPAFHAAVFSGPAEHRVVLNIGGIANLTDLRHGYPVRGFDSGPGNILLDAWIGQARGLTFDDKGEWASQGRIVEELLGRLGAHSFFSAPPPKSCGRDEFNLDWLGHADVGRFDPRDVQATLLELTASSISGAIAKWCGTPDRILACGGGTRNEALMDRLRELTSPSRLETTDSVGQHPDWVEAVAFAWLAWRTLTGDTGSLPEVTGARGPRILGAVYPA